MNKFNLMDVTLRDGSYAINFQFSLAQEKKIIKGLEDLGIEYIEIGHGQGLNASSPKNGVALHSDEEYLKAAQETLTKSKYGVFCIPEIARVEDIELAKKYGVSFIRVGTNVTDVEKSEPYIKKAKELGIMVMANYMKSQGVSADYLAKQVLKSESYGADCVYVVDSAGCMTPNQLENIYKEIRKVSNIKLGFHGHNNLGIVLWNCFKAVELGFEFIDCSLQGMGRSLGNASLEQFIICSNKLGYQFDCNIKELLTLSKQQIYPLVHKLNSIDVMCGATGIHTGYLGTINKVSGKYGVNPLELMEKYAKSDQIYMDAEKLEQIAKTMPEDLKSLEIIDLNGYFGYGQY